MARNRKKVETDLVTSPCACDALIAVDKYTVV